MDNNELIKALLKELVTEDMLRDVIGRIVLDRLDDLFTYHVKCGIEEQVEKEIRSRSDGYIKEVVDRVIDGMVRVDDGWGNVKEYGSFDDLVRARIAKQLGSSWSVEEKVREAVDAKIKKLCEQVRKEHVDNMAEQVMERLASQEARDDR